jgi:hypothetical protein
MHPRRSGFTGFWWSNQPGRDIIDLLQQHALLE